jgi:Zn-dependent peptidase ImmA (M78 family)
MEALVKMNYKNLYKDLALVLTSLGCFVCDDDYLGFCRYTKDIKAFICVDANMSYQHKYFVLAHEAGHLFYMKKGKIFNWSKKARSEDQANFFAIQLLKLAGVNKEDYYMHYDKASKHAKKRKKSWFQL